MLGLGPLIAAAESAERLDAEPHGDAAAAAVALEQRLPPFEPTPEPALTKKRPHNAFSYETKTQLCERVLADRWSIRQAAIAAGVPRATAQGWIWKCVRGIDLHEQPHPGRTPSKATKEAKETIQLCLAADNSLTYEEVG